MLFVRRQVANHIGLRNQLFVSANNKAVVAGVFPGGTFFINGSLAQCVGNIQSGVTHVQALVKALGATADNNDFFAFQDVAAVRKFTAVHKTAFAQLFQLDAQWQGIKVVGHVSLRVG